MRLARCQSQPGPPVLKAMAVWSLGLDLLTQPLAQNQLETCGGREFGTPCRAPELSDWRLLEIVEGRPASGERW